MESLTVAGVVAVISAVLGIAATYFGMKRNIKADAVAEGKNNGIILIEIQHIKDGIAEIKKEYAKTNDQITGFIKEMAVMENSLKVVHKRVDEVNVQLKSMEKRR